MLPLGMRAGLRRLDPAARKRDLGLQLLTASRFKDALRVYQELTARLPGHPFHWIGLGQAQLGLHQLSAARSSFQRALEAHPEEPRVLVTLAGLETRLGHGREAARLFKKAFKIAAGAGFESWPSDQVRAVATIAEERADWPAAEVTWRELLRRHNIEGGVWAHYLFCLIRQNRDQEAREAVTQAVKTSSDLLSLHGLMEAYGKAGNVRRSRLLNRFMVRRWPHSLGHRLRYVRLLAAEGKGTAADRLLAGEGVSAETPNDLLLTYCQRPFLSSEYAEAEARYRWLLESYPERTGAAVEFGYVLANTQGFDEAEMFFEAQARNTLLSSNALRGLAHMAMRRRDHEETARRWKRVADLYPSDAEAVVQTARALFDAGDADGALSTCRRWLAQYAPTQGVVEFKAWLLLALGRYDEAINEAQEAISLYGPSWKPLEILVQARGSLGVNPNNQLQASHLPRISTWTDLNHFYALIRFIEYYGTADAIINDGSALINPDLDTGWIHAYRLHARTPTVEDGSAHSKARRNWTELQEKISSAGHRRFEELTSGDVQKILNDSRGRGGAVHIINLFEQASGGSELHAIDVGARLKPYASVEYWSLERPHPALTEMGVKAMDIGQGRYPRGGVILFVGVYFNLGYWLRMASPERVIILYNTFDAVRLYRFIDEIYRLCGVKVELLFCSDMMRKEVRLIGTFEPSPIDLSLFERQPVARDRRFTIGRHSRDVMEKHHVEDGAVYSALVEAGAYVELLGATCMSKIFPEMEGLKLRPAQRGGIQAYLSGLDCFYYRTGTWIEPWGRVVIEAMAMGLPVVVHERGGYAEAVQSGVDGFIFSTQQQAIDQLTALKDDIELRERIGDAARRKVQALLGPEAMKRLVAYYLMDPSGGGQEARTNTVPMEERALG